MGTNFLPTRESELVTYTNHFDEQLTAKATQVGLTSADATAFHTLNLAWVESYALAQGSTTRTKPALQAKSAAKAACVARLRELARVIQNHPGTTDTLRADFQLTIPKPRSPIDVPTESPSVEVTERNGNTVYVLLHDGSRKAAKPAGVQGARVYTYVGETPPVDVADWFEEGQTTNMRVELAFASDLPAGTKVWISAAYYNPRGQLGPGCMAVATFLAGAQMQLQQQQAGGSGNAALKAA